MDPNEMREMQGSAKHHKFSYAAFLWTLMAVCIAAFFIWSRFVLTNQIQYDGKKVSVHTVMETQEHEKEQELFGHYGRQLVPKEQLLYRALAYAYQHGNKEIKVAKEYDLETIERVHSMLKADYPQYPTSSLALTITTSALITTIELSDQELLYVQRNREMTQQAAVIVNKMPPFDTQMKKAKYLYDWLCTNVRYSAQVQSQPQSDVMLMTGVFIDRVANCDGFASALQLLYQLAGIDCYKVYYHGEDVGQDVGHVWNIASIDSVSYHIDASRGASVTEQLSSSVKAAGEGNGKLVSNSGFCLTTRQICLEGTIISPQIQDYIDPCETMRPPEQVFDVAVGEGEEAQMMDRLIHLATQAQGDSLSICMQFEQEETLEKMLDNLALSPSSEDSYIRRISKESQFYGTVTYLVDPMDENVLILLLSRS